MDYVKKALNVSIFPLSMIPYTLEDFKNSVGELGQNVKKNMGKTILIALILGLGITAVVIYNKNS